MVCHVTDLASLPSFAALRCFDAAAKHESFTAAAEELGLTQGAVSRHVKDLEVQVGTALFAREGRGVRLNDAGRALATNLSSDLDRLRRTINQAMASGSAAKVLSIAVLPTFGARWLLPRLPHFKSQHPALELIVHSRSAPFNLVEEGIDVAIHFGVPDWPGTKLTTLCGEQLVVVAAAELVSRSNSSSPSSILEMPLLHLSSRPMLWETFSQTYGGAPGSARKGSYFDQFSLIITAATAGMGAAILPAYLIENELGDGSLLRLAELPDVKERKYYVATPAGVSKPLASQFTQWLRKQVSRN